MATKKQEREPIDSEAMQRFAGEPDEFGEIEGPVGRRPIPDEDGNLEEAPPEAGEAN